MSYETRRDVEQDHLLHDEELNELPEGAAVSVVALLAALFLAVMFGCLVTGIVR